MRRCAALTINILSELDECLSATNGNDDAPRYCDCLELLDSRGHRRPAPVGHSCEYVRQRNALIKEAAETACEIVPELVPASEDDGVSAANWTSIFSAAMNRLSAPLLNSRNGSNGSTPPETECRLCPFVRFVNNGAFRTCSATVVSN